MFAAAQSATVAEGAILLSIGSPYAKAVASFSSLSRAKK